MNVLTEIYRNFIWIGIPLFCISLALLGTSIVGVIRMVRNAVIMELPLAEEQHIEFAHEGPVNLCIEGPRFTRRFANLSYELRCEDGRIVDGRPVVFRTSTSGFSTFRMALRRYSIPGPGGYIFRIHGLGQPQDNDAAHQIVFMKPNGLRMLAWILGIVFGAQGTIASFVIFVLRVLGK